MNFEKNVIGHNLFPMKLHSKKILSKLLSDALLRKKLGVIWKIWTRISSLHFVIIIWTTTFGYIQVDSGVLITALIKHWCLGKLQVYMFWRKVLGIHEKDFKKLWRFLYKNLTGLYRNIWEFTFSLKTFKFSCKNGQIFLKKSSELQETFSNFSGKFHAFFLRKSANFYRKM